jgi:hypothetical protein
MHDVERTVEVDFNNVDGAGRVRVPRKLHEDLSYGDIVRLRDSVEDMEMAAVLNGSTQLSLLFALLPSKIKLESNIPLHYSFSTNIVRNDDLPSQRFVGQAIKDITFESTGVPCGISD